MQHSNNVSIGWQAITFALPDANGKTYQMENLLGENGLVVVFMCNHCPYVKAIGNRLAEDANALEQDGVNIVGINSNDYTKYPADSPENMLMFSKQYNLEFPYLIDEDQSIARQYEAVCTPEFFGFNKDAKLAYRGRLDDARMDSAPNRTRELVDAMHQVATHGAVASEQYASMGCSIKWK